MISNCICGSQSTDGREAATKYPARILIRGWDCLNAVDPDLFERPRTPEDHSQNQLLVSNDQDDLAEDGSQERQASLQLDRLMRKLTWILV